MRVLIVGAGLSGMVLATALKRVGLDGANSGVDEGVAAPI
jgi:cation diffusion facilitator CzcD-associated flavoprotein CzcO